MLLKISFHAVNICCLQVTIQSINFDGDNATKFLSPPGIIGTPHSIAIDWVNRNMYVGSTDALAIFVSTAFQTLNTGSESLRAQVSLVKIAAKSNQ